MKKAGTDPKVKKTLVRNCEQKIRNDQHRVIHDVDASSSKIDIHKSCHWNENDLARPSLCSSEALATYLTNNTIKNQPALETEDLNVDLGQLSLKITKKLNFHFNDRIYKNLVELNADTASLKNKREKKLARPSSVKRDMEPKIEDFYEDDEEIDICPTIPVIKHKVKPVQYIENGQLHKLVASYELFS